MYSDVSKLFTTCIKADIFPTTWLYKFFKDFLCLKERFKCIANLSITLIIYCSKCPVASGMFEPSPSTFVVKWSVTAARDCKANNCRKIIAASFAVVAQFGFDTFDRLLCIVGLSPRTAPFAFTFYISPLTFGTWACPTEPLPKEFHNQQQCDKNKLGLGLIRGWRHYVSRLCNSSKLVWNEADGWQIVNGAPCGRDMTCSCHQRGFVERHLQYASS